MSEDVRRRPRLPGRAGRHSTILAATLAALAAGCGPPPIETAPAVAPAAPRRARPRPDRGPWLVDRAGEFGLAVVTRQGSPEKPSVLHAMGTGAALFDADGDGDLDLFVAPGTTVRDGAVARDAGPWLFRNDGPGRWVDSTAGSGLGWTGWAQGVAVSDYDGDGDLDLFIAHHGPDALWRNRGDGTFEEVAAASGIVEDHWGVSAAWGDADGDGRPDLYVANYLEVDPVRPPPRIEYMLGAMVFAGPTALPGQPDALWRNRGDGTFENVIESAGLDADDGKGMGVTFADLDDDGRPDLYLTNDTQPNALYRNLGGCRFEDTAFAAGVAVNAFGNPEGSMGVAAADVDGDGRLDLAVSNFRHEGTRLYRNRDGQTFEDISTGSFVQVNTLRFVGWGLALADLDSDGRPDLFQADGHVYPNVPDSDYDQTPIVMRNAGDGTFKPVTDAWGPALDALRSGRGVAVGDLDEDGDLDVVMTTIDGPLRVLIDEGTRAGHVCRVRLVGRPPNTEALGARVVVESGGRRHVAEVIRGGSMLSASDVRLHFGLGSRSTVDRIRVRWPDGSEQVVEAPPADALLTIRQGRAEPDVRPYPITIPHEARTR